MQTEHRIDELIVDLSFNTTRLARHEKALLSDWLSEDLLPALDQLFSRYSPGQQVLRFEKLEFDFGNLTNRNYQQTIRQQLLQQFAQLLQTQILAIVPTHPGLPEQINRGDNSNPRLALTQLIHYLASGQLSAHQPFKQPGIPGDRNLASANSASDEHSVIAKESDTSELAEKKYAANNRFTDSQDLKKIRKPIFKQTGLHEQLLDAVIAQQDIADLLRELPQRDLVITRLLTQFPVSQRLELLRQLAPQQVQNTIALLDLLQLFERNAINAAAYPLDSNLLWQVLLQLGLEYPQANTEFWLSRIFNAFSATAIKVNLLQQQLVAISIPFSAAATPLINLQRQIAQLLSSENESDSEKESRSEPVVAVQFASNLADNSMLSSVMDTRVRGYDEKGISHSFSGSGGAESEISNSALLTSELQNSEQQNLTQSNPQQSNAKETASEPSNQTLENAAQSNTEHLRQRIAAAFIRADAAELQQLWLQLLANQSPLLLAALKHYLPQAEIRQALMLRLPLIVQLDMIALLAPTLKPLFLQLHNNAAQLRELLSGATATTHELKNALARSNTLESPEHSPNSLSSDSMLRQLWEIALGLIFNYQPSVATADYGGTREFFVMSLAARYADLHNLDSNIVQQVFFAVLNEPQLPQSSHVNSADQPTGVISCHRNSGAEKNPQFVEREDSPALAVTAETANQLVTRGDINRAQEPSRDIANSTAGSLSSVSDHQLFDLCLRLKSGALSWQSLANDIPLLQRLISSYIRLGHSATAENCADFVAAIESQAELSSAPAAFYRAVLQSLIADRLIDLDAIALDVKSGTQSYSSASIPKIEVKEEVKIIENLSITKNDALPASVTYDLESGVASTSAIADVIRPLSLDALAEQLQQGKRTTESLNLADDQFALLIEIVIAKEKTIASDTQVNLIAAIHQQAWQTKRKSDYYRHVLNKLLRKEALDLVQVRKQVNQQEISSPALGSSNHVQPTGAVATPSNSIEAIARVLMEEAAPEQWLQSLQLDLAQWQDLVAELIQQMRVVDKNASAARVESIQTQARQATNPADYYRLVVASILKLETMDRKILTAKTNQQSSTFDDQHLVQEDDVVTNNLSLNELQGVGENRARRTELEATTTEAYSHQSIGPSTAPQFSSQQGIATNDIASIAHKPIDLEVFARAANSSAAPQSPANPHNNTGPNGSSITAATDVKSIAQTLLTEPQSWQRVQTLQFDNKQWETLTAELIRQTEFNDQQAAAELFGAIQTQARTAITSAVYYRLVIQALLQKKSIDLEAFATTSIASIDVDQYSLDSGDLNPIARNDAVISDVSLNKLQGVRENPARRTELEATTTEAYSHQSIGPSTAPQFPSQQGVATNEIASIVQALLTESGSERRLKTLQLELEQWQNLVAELIHKTKSIDKNASADLIEAVQLQARHAINPTHYYRLVVGAVLAHKPIDLEAFVRAANSFTESQSPANPHNNTRLDSLSITAATDVTSIAQALLTEPQSWQRVQALQFDNKQWEILTIELIRQTQFADPHARAELIEAIQTQARLAITPAVYYRLIIQALLKQDPIDLEAFTARSIATMDVNQFSPDSGYLNPIASEADSTATTDTSIYQQRYPIAPEPFSGENSNLGQFTSPVLNADPIDPTPVAPTNIRQDSIYSQEINPNPAIDYPLLPGRNNSLHKPALSLAELLAAGLPLNQEQLLALQQHVNALINRADPTLISEWRELLAAEQHTQVLIHSVPAHLLHQIALRLAANRYTWLDALVKMVMEALALLIADINSLAIKHAKWNFVFLYLFAANGTHNKAAETSARALELSFELCGQLAHAASVEDVQRLVNLTQRRIALLKPPAQQKPNMRLHDITTNPATHSDATTPQWEAGLHINNAGQVLAAAFLPRLFSMLNLMQDGKFIDLGAADRAVHLVQFMVTGQSITPEYDLILNKILCGISTSIPVSAGIEVTEQEQTLIEQMLTSMIQHWKVLGSTSITGLRETFFQRQGWLMLEDDCWRLKVKEQTFDLLLDRLPWSISLIKHGWMDKPLRVSWRNTPDYLIEKPVQ